MQESHGITSIWAAFCRSHGVAYHGRWHGAFHRLGSPSHTTPRSGVPLLALELGEVKWNCAFSVGFGQKPRRRAVVVGATGKLLAETDAGKQRFGLPEDAGVVCCYEAGRDGFWLHRFLIAQGV